jgi:membrane protein implicated in regulation of membrane protease activity
MDFADIVYWHWWIAGLVLLTLEAFMPGAIFLRMGVSAFAVGALSWLVPSLGWQPEFVLFGVLSVVTFFLYRRYKKVPVSDKPTLNRRGHSYVGRVFTLGEAIVNGSGKLHVDDSQWRITGPDLPAGSRVRVVDADGTLLKVEQAH